MTDRWNELKATIKELRDSGGTGTQQEVCKFLVNLMDVLEKQMQEPCKDCISRQAAIDLARDLCVPTEDGSIYRHRCIDPDAIRELPPVQPEQQWIPVSERLPETRGVYLVTYNIRYWDNVEEEIKVGIDSFRGKSTWAKMKYQRVIAWMPLPEACGVDEE